MRFYHPLNHRITRLFCVHLPQVNGKSPNFVTFFSAIFLSFCSYYLTSCSKSEPVDTIPTETSVILEKVRNYSSLHDMYLTTGRVTFESMSVEDGLWIIEATSNYDYRNSYDNAYIDDVALDTFEVTVENISEGVVDGNSLMNAYNDIYNFINEKLSTDRYVMVNDVILKSTSASETIFSIELITCTSTAVTTGRIEQTDGFGSTDYWYPIWDQGKCDVYAPDYAGSKDASDKLTVEVNKSLPLPACAGNASFGVDIEFVYYIEDYWPTSPYYFECYTNSCLDPTTLSSIHGEIVPNVPTHAPSGKLAKSVIVRADFAPILDPPYPCKFYYDAKYANVICEPNEE